MGLSVPRFDAHFTPCVEIGWRLDSHYWDKGYATEGGQAVVSFAFEELGFREIISFASHGNVRPIQMMQRLRMTHDPRDDFEHPSLPQGHKLR